MLTCTCCWCLVGVLLVVGQEAQDAQRADYGRTRGIYGDRVGDHCATVTRHEKRVSNYRAMIFLPSILVGLWRI
jgi:hypothetical protein